MTQTPFVSGGAEAHALSLKTALQESGHSAEILSMPFRGYPPELILDQMLAARLLNVEEANGQPIDLVIGLKFPAYLMRHSRKVIWLLHQHRGAYDLWGSQYEGLHLKPAGEEVRLAIKQADDFAFANVKVFANSRNVADRLMRFNGVKAEPLYHPPPRLEMLKKGEERPYLYYPSRVTAIKRQDLVIRAMSQCKSSPTVIFSGAIEDERYLRHLKNLSLELGVARQVEFRGFVNDQEKADLISHCRGVIYIPFDEDYGYVPIEAMASSKPVLSTMDAGGGREFVEHEVTGLLSEPSPEHIADALDRCWTDTLLRRRWGAAGFDHFVTLDLSWSRVIETLLAI